MSDEKVKGNRYDWGDVEVEPLDSVKIGEYRARYRLYMSDPNRVRLVNKIKALQIGDGLKLTPPNGVDKVHAEAIRNFAYTVGVKFGIKISAHKLLDEDGKHFIVVERLAKAD